MKYEETGVVVVGGGSVGLAMALELGWQGLPVVLVERTDGSITSARAGSLSVRSVEYCRRWGILDQIQNCGFPGKYRLDTVFCTSLSGYELARRDGGTMDDPKVLPESPVHRQRCPQMFLDPIFARNAGAFDNVDIRHRCAAESLHDEGGRVVVLLADEATGERSKLRARYVVACDGAKSAVRESLGIGMSGDPLLGYSLNILLQSPGLSEKLAIGQAERYIFVGEGGSWGNLTVVDGTNFWRLTVILGSEKIDLQAFDVDKAVGRAFGTEPLDYEVVSIQPWRRSALVADRFHKGNVLIAGDAAHTMSPTGGFGMNTGLSDVVNLGWKLRALFDGWGGEALLASYSAERQPVAVRNVNAGTRNFRGWLPGIDLGPLDEPGPAGDALRAELGKRLMEGTHEEWESIGVMLGYRYEGSPICVQDGSPPPPDPLDRYLPVARPGHRAPHFWIESKMSSLDLFSRTFTLLAFGEEPDAGPFVEAATRRKVGLRVERIRDSAAGELYGQPLVLVRPDGHVAWRGPDAGRAAEVLDVARGAVV